MIKKKIARRKFLKKSSAVAVAAASQLVIPESVSGISNATVFQQSLYQGALSDYDLRNRQLDTLQFCLASYEQIKPSMSFAAKNKTEARQWQKRVRTKLTELL